MKTPLDLKAFALIALATVLVPSEGARGEDPAPAEASASADSKFSAAQLEQMVAPIALYPDSLLMQILMAATYPLEIVQAQRWLDANPSLAGTKLEEGLKEKDWDPSVKSLCTLKDVLKNMSDTLDWTQDLGDAFLGQKEELLDTVQRMRQKAEEAGNLKTTEQQTVTVQEDKIIVIESTNPEVVYVPTYSPVVVYGGWSYPTWHYPYYYRPVPPGYGAVTFAAGVAVGAAIWGGCHWGWGRTEVNINVNRYNQFNRNTTVRAERYNIQSRPGSGDRAAWEHRAEHRKGVGYNQGAVAERYGASAGNTRVTRDQARGYDRAATTAARSPSTVSGRTPGAATTWPSTSPTTRPSTPTTRPSTGVTRTTPSAPVRSTTTSSVSRGTTSSAWSGSRQPSLERSASARGSYSRSGGSISRPSSIRGGAVRRR